MKVIFPDYNRCITNLACSIMKYFELEYSHNTIPEVDDVLKNNPKNVIVILCDGMGTNILKRTLPSEAFLIKHFDTSITSVSPATTTASTTSVLSGLNPNEHGWLGWDLYVKPIDKIVTLYLNTLKADGTQAGSYNVANKFFPYEDIPTQINNAGKYTSKVFFPFREDAYNDLDDMINRVVNECNNPGKKYLYVYYDNPDSLQHEYGTDSKEATENIILINEKIEELSNKLNDSLIIVVADHGHINCDSITISDYPDFLALLDNDIWIESRLCAFKIKENRDEEFKALFNKYFGNDFILKSKSEIISENLLGIGESNILFEDSLGDYLALAITNKFFRYDENSVNYKSMHAGLTEDEMLIPLIKIYKK